VVWQHVPVWRVYCVLCSAKGFSLEASNENATPIFIAVNRNTGRVKHLDTHSDRVALLKTMEVLFLHLLISVGLNSSTQP